MKKYLIITSLLLVFIGTSALFGVEKFSQKIGLIIQTNSSNYIFDKMVYDAVISKAEFNSDIHIFPLNEKELRNRKVEKLNGKVLIRTDVNDGVLVVALYIIEENSTNLFDNSVGIERNDFINKIDNISVDLIATILKVFPRKEKKQMKEYVGVKRQLSQFENNKPTFSVNANVLWQQGSVSINLRSANDNNEHRKSADFQNIAFSLNGAMNYRRFNVGLDLLIGENLSAISTDIGLGFWGSVFVFGLNVGLYRMGETFGTPMVYNTSEFDETSNNDFYIENINALTINLGLFIKVNITKRYFFKIAVSGSPYSSMSVEMSGDGEIDLTGSGGGGPASKILFNIGISDKARITINWVMLDAQYRYNSKDSSYEKKIVYDDANVSIHAEELQISSYFLGVGFEYEF